MGNVFLAGIESSLVLEMTQEALGLGGGVVTALARGGEGALPDAEQRNLVYVPWNARSPVSAKSVVTGALTVCGELDEVFFVFSAAPGGREFHEMSCADIEGAVDGGMKGFPFLAREIFTVFRRQGRGALTFVLSGGAAEGLSPLQAAASGAFRSFAAALFAQYKNEPFVMYGHEAFGEERAFSRFLMGASSKTEKSARKWVKFSGKPGLFSFGRNK
ncbi:MAG: hypothetical protein LBC67_04745 [Spirochaetales bacterium]|nr:hypothetical protein [Spirochaetales bacterium]